MLTKTRILTPAGQHLTEFDNIRELLEMLMSEHTPAKHKIKMKTSFGWEPPMNVFETDGEFVVVMDIAGMDPRDIAVFTDGAILRISGVRKDSSAQGRKQFHALEIQVGPFQPASLSQRYANGLLEIRLKKKGDTPTRRRIDVK